MATIYNKTALKKIKKDELVQMFLNQQAKLNDVMMDIDGDGLLKEGYKTELSNSHKQQNRMVKEITKLKEENENLKQEIKDSEYTRKHENLQWQNTCEKQDEQIWQLTEEIHSRMSKEQEKELEQENEDLKQEIKILKEILDEVRVYIGGFDSDELDVFDMIVKREKQDEQISQLTEEIHSRMNKEKENEKVKLENENLKEEVKFWTFKADEFERKYIQTDENYKLHRKSADIYEEKLIEEIQILRKKNICDICGNAPAGY